MPNLGQLRTRGQRSADLVNHANVPDAEWNDYANESEDEIYDLLVEAGLDLFVASPQSLISSGSGSFALPADHYRTLRVAYKNGTRWDPLSPIHPHNIDEMDYANGSRSDYYAFAGSNIVLYPTPAAGQEYRHVYAPRRTQLTADGDNSVIPDRWIEGVVLLMAIKALTKQKRDIRNHFLLWEKYEARLKRARLNRRIESMSAATPRGGPDEYFTRPYSRFW